MQPLEESSIDEATVVNIHDQNLFLRDLICAQTKSLTSFFMRHVHSRENADDLTQEVFLRMVKRKGLEKLENPVGFMFRTATNLLTDDHRRRKARVHDLQVPYNDDDIVSEMPDQERYVLSEEIRNSLQCAFNELKPKQKEALSLHRFEGLTYSQIANRMGVSVSMVEKYISQALVICRKRLREFV
ncbi:MAG: RNA polymerase sigma factor [Gammaproteobacteria bacterium]|jgi:RNA polymerase sigma factor (sigma-70 family)|nr:RNA polymerase sigma factor [Gammaproteobacteria bacterium]